MLSVDDGISWFKPAKADTDDDSLEVETNIPMNAQEKNIVSLKLDVTTADDDVVMKQIIKRAFLMIPKVK